MFENSMFCVVATLASLFFSGPSSFLQVTRMPPRHFVKNHICRKCPHGQTFTLTLVVGGSKCGPIGVTGEKDVNHLFCPGRGSNQGLLRSNPKLYCVAVKAGLYREAIQVCIIPSTTTYSPSILDSSPNLN